ATDTQDPGEPGLADVGVVVTWAGFDGLLGSADDVDYPATTDEFGNYLVDHLPYGAYSVAVVPGTLPDGMVETFDLDGIGAGSIDVAVTALDAQTPDRDDVDFSYTGTGSLGDRVWLDVNGDSEQDPGEQGLFGLPVELVWFGPDGQP